MFNYIPEFFKGETADNEKEADRWYAGQEEQPAHAGPPAARRGGAGHQLRGEGRARHACTAACSSTSARAGPPTTSASACPPCTTSSRSWPASTSPRRRWRSGPTCHYIMGGVRVDADSTAATRARPLRGRRGGGRHARRNRLGGNSLVRPARVRAPRGARTPRSYVQEPRAVAARWTRARWSRSRARMLEPFTRSGGENPYAIHVRPAGRACTTLVGIIRIEGELRKALEEIAVLKQRARRRSRVEGGRDLQPGLAPGARPATRCSRSPRR